MSFFNRPVSNHAHKGITLTAAVALSLVLASCGSSSPAAATPTTPVTPLAVPNLANATATTLVVGTAATINFTNNGGGTLLADDATPNRGCTATNLPAGLAIGRTSNTNSCTITGTPNTATTEAVTVTVTARNATGVDATPATVSITINPADPGTTLALPNLAYTGTDVSAVIGTAITTIAFTNSGDGELLANDAATPGCSTSPALPSGLTIQRTADNSSCEITGTPDAVKALDTYTVTARNATGPDTTAPEVKIAVRAVATAAIPNFASRILGNVYIPLSVTFTNNGDSVAATNGCTLKDAATLPTGLNLTAVDVEGTMTCRISGIPSQAKTATYTLVATSIDATTDEATFYLEVEAQEEDPQACQMSADYITTASTTDATSYPVTAGGETGRLYLNGGTFTEGGDNPSFVLRYKGPVDSKHVYQAAVEFNAATATTNFKITSDDGTDSTEPTTQFYVQTATATTVADIETTALATDGTALPVARGDATGVSTSNTADLSAENPFLFTLTLDTANPANGLGAGTLAIAACTDTTNPTATATATPASSQSATAGAISFTASEAGTAYVLLLPPPGAGESAPDADAVVANAASVEENVEAGAVTVSINTRTRADSTPLTAETTYAAYVVIRDEANNLSEVIKITDITTTPAATADTTAPTVSAVTVDGIVALGATLNLTSNEPGDVFVVTLPAATPAPTTADAIINPAVNSDSNEDNDVPHTRADITADTTTAVAITGLDPATDYTAHYTVVDVAGNATAVASTTPTFTTLELAPYLAPAIDQLNLVANSAEDGAVNIIFANLTGTTLLAQDATTPGCQATGLPAGLTITQIDQDEDDGGTTCQITGTVTLATTDGPVIATITATSAGGSSTTVVLFAVAAATTTTDPVLTVTDGTDARTFPIDTLITPIVISFTNGGNNPACTVEPALPQGLNATLAADKMSCTIAGTPSAATASKVYTITVANGAQTGMATVTIGTTDPTDTTDPTLSPITATAPTGSSVTVNLTSTENGTGYVLVSATSATLTAQDVITRVNADVASDFVATPTLTADMAATANITGLQATTQYFVYAVATDASANPSIVRTTSFTTTVATDTTAPTLNPAPTVTATSDTTATVSLTSNEAGTGYILITARDAASTLDNAAIIARVIAAASSDVVATAAITIPGTATTTNITGLTASTTYTAYIVATDNAATPNNSTVATVDFATEAVADVTAPMISSFTVTALSLNEVQVEVVNNEDGDLSVIILPAADTTPIPSAVTTPGPNTISLSAAVTERMSTHTVTGLASNTRYAAYAVLTDASGNPSDIAAIADVNAFATTNAPPVANAGSVSTVLVGGTATLNGRGSTDDGAITTYAWAQTTTPTGVTGTLTGADTDTAIFTPTAGTAAGDVVFTLTVTDNGNVEDNASPLTHSDTVTVTVALVADTTDPVISAVSSSNGTVNSVDITLTSNESGSVAVLAYLNGTTQPDVAAIKAATGDGSVQSNVEADTPLTLTVPGLSSNTLYILAIVATDGSANDSMVATENIVTDNAAPVASTSGSPTTANTGDPVMLTGTASTDDGMIASYAWVETSNTTNTPITLDDNTSSTPSFTVASTSTAGEIVFTLTVTDDGVATTNLQPLSDTATVTIVVSDTTNPVFTELSPDVTISPGPVTLSTVVLAFNSNEAGPVAMLVLAAGDNVPPPAVIKVASGDGSIKGTAVAGQMQSLTAAGLNSNTSYKAYAVVTDLAGNVSEVASSASFKTLNAAPIANAGATQPVLANAMVGLNGGGTDVDSDDMTLTYLWTQTSGTTVTLSSTSIANPTFDASVADDAGETLVFNLVVTDSDGLASVAASTSVVVAPVPLARPDLQTPTPAAFVYEPGASITAISFVNDGGAKLTECVAAPALPTGLIIAPTADNTSCTITGTAPATAVAIMTHTITATNATGDDATPVDITITVNLAVNADPTITIATATNTVAPGAAVTLSGGCADSDGSIASCVWTYTSGGTAPALTLATSAQAITATFIAANTGNTNITLVFTLTATDNEGATATATASVTISPATSGALVLDSIADQILILSDTELANDIDLPISQGSPSATATCAITATGGINTGLMAEFVATPEPVCRLSGTISDGSFQTTISVQITDGSRTSNIATVRIAVGDPSSQTNEAINLYVGVQYISNIVKDSSFQINGAFHSSTTCALAVDQTLPAGLTIQVVSSNTSCGIVGTPVAVSTGDYTLVVNNGFGQTTITLTLTVSNGVSPQFALPAEVTSLEAEQAITTPIQLVNTSVATTPEAAIEGDCIQVNSANPAIATTIAVSNGLTVTPECTLTGTPTNPVQTTIYIRATGMNRIPGISTIVIPITMPGGNIGPTVTATSDAPTATTVTLTSSVTGQAYILVVADALDTLNMPTPTAIRTMVKAATEGATVDTVDVTADMATTAKIGGLVANTLYKVYVATEDAQDIISQSAPSATFTTTVDLLVTPIEILHFRVVNQSIDPIDIAFTGTPTTPIACTSDNLPMGLEIAPLNGNSCQITGTPTIAALTEIEFRVTDASSPAAVGTGTVMILVSESLDGNTLGASSIVTKLSYRENEMRRESNGDLTGDSVISISSRFTSSTRNVVTCTAVDKPLPAGLEIEATSFGKNCYIYGRALKATPLDTYTILVVGPAGSATVDISIEVLPAKLATLTLPTMVPEIRLNAEIASADSIKLVNTNTESGLNDVSCQLVTSNSVDASPVAAGGQDGWQASGAGALCGIFGTPTKLGLNTLYVLIENKDGAKSVSTIEITTTAPVLTVDAPTEIQTVGLEQPIDPIILQVSGNPTTPVTCTATGIPAGLEIKPTADTESCEIVGTPTALGDSTVAFTITDATIPASTVSGMVKIQVGNLPSTTEAITLSVRADESLGVRDVSDTSKNVPNIKLFFFTNGTVDPFFNPKTNACNFVTSEASPAGIMLETSSSGDSCYIYGTPTVALSQRTYTIVASNQYGDTLVDISIEVLPASTGGISGASGASAAQPPSANAGADQTVANAGGIVVIDASTSSAGDSEIAQYAWSQTSGTRVALYGTNTALASFNPADTGLNGDELSFTVTITSSTGQTATDEVVVNVLPARPSLNSPTYTHIVSAGEPMAPIVLSNTGGGRLLAQAGCTANNLPKGLSISLSTDGHTCQIGGTPTTAQDNPISISIQATNATGTATSAAEVSLLVQ